MNTGKWIVHLVSVIVVYLFCVASAQAEIIDVKKHGQWKSCIFSMSGEQTVVMSCSGYHESSLHIQMFPRSEKNPIRKRELFMFVKSVSEDKLHDIRRAFPMTLKGQMRADMGKIYDTVFTFSLYDDNIFVSFPDSLTDALIREGQKGNTMRFKVDSGNKHFFFKYSLIGFSAAYSRCLELLDRLERKTLKDPDKKYFEPEPYGGRSKRPRSDAEYFF